MKNNQYKLEKDEANMFKTFEPPPPWIPPAEDMTASANRALELAESEAKRFKHGYIGAEHLLLAIVALAEGVASSSLKAQGMTLEKLKKDVNYQVGTGGSVTARKPLAFSPTMKKIIAMGIGKARSLGHELAGPEHLLEAIIEEDQNIALTILRSMKVDPGKVQKEMLK